MEIDKGWFFERLERQGKSLRDLAKHMDIDVSAASRMMSGLRKMKLPEAEKIGRFLGVPTEEILTHAGVSLGTNRFRELVVSAEIAEDGQLKSLDKPYELPSAMLVRAQRSIPLDSNVVVAHVRASRGPLQLWDDAVVLFEDTDQFEPTAVGVLSMLKLREGIQMLGHLDTKPRTTGEAVVTTMSGESKEVQLSSAAPILAFLP